MNDDLFSNLSAIEFTNRSNYEKRIKTALNNFRGQLNYAYLYEKTSTDTSWSVMNKYYFHSILVDFMAKAIIDKIKTWPLRQSKIPERFMKDLENFIQMYCDCGSLSMKDSLNDRVTQWFQEMPNNEGKSRLVGGYIVAFNDAFGVSLNYE